jgi:hypothetical protein
MFVTDLLSLEVAMPAFRQRLSKNMKLLQRKKNCRTAFNVGDAAYDVLTTELAHQQKLGTALV